MKLAQDYFLLYHGKNIDAQTSVCIDEKIDDEAFFEIASLLLSLTRKNYETFIFLDNFKKLYEILKVEQIKNLNALYALQKGIIGHLLEHKNQSNLKHLHLSFNYLNEENVISKEIENKLISIFDPSTLKPKEKAPILLKPEQDYQKEKQNLLTTVHELIETVGEHKDLDKLLNYLMTQKFSIGITGVMNAGKSSMLNALMGREVLGTNVVPETANLTLLKYSSEPRAKVVYWSKSQWEKIKKTALEVPSIESFVKETELAFKENFNEYICDKAKEETIDVESLSQYTSASKKYANLVEHVELFMPLSFLKEGIEIIDTPGLDDIVLQREEITKAYVSECDLLIHLMNVSQSATQKDLNFIIDALLYQNVSKLLIVLTRSDMVSKKQMQEVINYTKEAIKKELHALNQESKLDFVLQNLHFITLSSKMAFLHKTGKEKEALKAGYSLEDTGIPALEAYLNETLFGPKSQKSMLIIRSAKKSLFRFFEHSLLQFKNELTYLSHSKEGLENELKKVKEIKKENESSLGLLKVLITGFTEEIFHYQKHQKHFFHDELEKLQDLIIKRILDETAYSLKNSHKPLEFKVIEKITLTALKHGLIDIVRNFTYKLSKKTTRFNESTQRQYKEVYTQEYTNEANFTQAFEKGFLIYSFDILVLKLSQVLKKVKEGNLEQKSSELSSVLNEAFTDLEPLLIDKAMERSKKILDLFFQELNSPIQDKESWLEEQEMNIKQHLENINEDKQVRESKSLLIAKKIKSIEHIQKRCLR